MKKGLIGLDLGTTTIKAALVDEEGRMLATAAREYVLETSGDFCEIAAECYWTNSVAVIRELLSSPAIDTSAIEAISFSCQGETLICLDKEGMPLRKAIVWLDNRSNEEGREIWNFFGQEAINTATGQTEILPFWTAGKILWIRKHEPAVFRRIGKFLLVADYIIYRLTGQYATDQSLNSSTLYYDIYKKEWWQEMLGFLGIEKKQLPQVYPSGTAICGITAAAAKETGLPQGLTVVAGTFDHVAGALGAGNIRAGMVTETTGASMAMVVTLNKPIENISLNLPVQAHAMEGKYLLLPYAQTAGMMFRWFRDTFCEMEINLAANHKEDAYDQLTASAAAVAPGSEGLLVLPHLMGSGSPEFNVNAKAVFAGIKLGMTKAHFTRAILESIAYMIKKNLETLQAKGITVKEIMTLGGGAKSDLWNQIKADVTGIPIHTLYSEETASAGAAILAGLGSGIFASAEEGCNKIVKIKKSYFPVRENQERYSFQYRQYKLLSDTMEPFWQAVRK